MSSTIIVLAVIVVFVLWAVMVYNGLISMRQRVNQAFADVDVQLKQRHDLVPNLVETVKGYAAHERGNVSVRTGGRRRTDILLQHGAYLFVRFGFTTTGPAARRPFEAKLNDAVNPPL